MDSSFNCKIVKIFRIIRRYFLISRLIKDRLLLLLLLFRFSRYFSSSQIVEEIFGEIFEENKFHYFKLRYRRTMRIKKKKSIKQCF